jgi:hypothetical protein
MPKGINLEHMGMELLITRKWFSPKYIFLTVFALFWNGFMVVWYSIAISQKMWAMAGFGAIHTIVGLSLIYIVLSGFLNKTYIKVSHQNLNIKHGPVPHRGMNMISSQIRQLYCKEKIQRSRNSTSTSYEVRAATVEGKDKKLLKGLEKSEQALYLEQEIERFLGIKDQIVSGEIGH